MSKIVKRLKFEVSEIPIYVLFPKLVLRVSSGYPNTEKQMKARGRRPSAFIVLRCLDTPMKHKARVLEIHVTSHDHAQTNHKQRLPIKIACYLTFLHGDVKVAGFAGIYMFSCRLVRMYTATKSFERFRQPKSVEDEKKSVDNAVPKSTACKTKWSCKVFEE